MAGLPLAVTPAARDDLDAEIRRAERDYHAAFADQQALGRECSDAEAKAWRTRGQSTCHKAR